MGSGNPATSNLDPAGGEEGDSQVCAAHTPDPGTMEGGRRQGWRGEGTENRARGPSQTPGREKMLSARFLPRSEAESASPRGGGGGRNKPS